MGFHSIQLYVEATLIFRSLRIYVHLQTFRSCMKGFSLPKSLRTTASKSVHQTKGAIWKISTIFTCHLQKLVFSTTCLLVYSFPRNEEIAECLLNWMDFYWMFPRTFVWLQCLCENGKNGHNSHENVEKITVKIKLKVEIFCEKKSL